MILAKGTKIEQYSDDYIQNTADWLNDYPRGIFDYQTSRDLFNLELRKMGLKSFAKKFSKTLDKLPSFLKSFLKSLIAL